MQPFRGASALDALQAAAPPVPRGRRGAEPRASRAAASALAEDAEEDGEPAEGREPLPGEVSAARARDDRLTDAVIALTRVASALGKDDKAKKPAPIIGNSWTRLALDDERRAAVVRLQDHVAHVEPLAHHLLGAQARLERRKQRRLPGVGVDAHRHMVTHTQDYGGSAPLPLARGSAMGSLPAASRKPAPSACGLRTGPWMPLPAAARAKAHRSV